jgi:long-subunit acyl-CoA synthetase (AMP-forming)
MRGYHGRPTETAETLDADGWLHTGDIGNLRSDGHLSITDRKKDLIKTSGGKYVAPQVVEGLLKVASPLISYAILPSDLKIENGELTPSLKVRRKTVEQHYRQILDGLYAEAPPAKPD